MTFLQPINITLEFWSGFTNTYWLSENQELTLKPGKNALLDPPEDGPPI